MGHNLSGEIQHLEMQSAAQAVQNLVFYIDAHISAYDPGTHRIKAIIPAYTDSSSTPFMETGWLQLGTVWSGNGFGLQIAPYGGANINDITGQDTADGKPVNPEQVILQVIYQDNTLMIGGVLTFNQVDVPPGTGSPTSDMYGNPQRIQLSSGEAIMRHSSGSYLLFRNDGSVSINADTSPQIPFQEPSMSALVRDINLTANTNLDSGAPDATTLTANANLLSIVGNPDVSASVPSGGTLNSTVQVTAATNGQDTNTGNSTIALLANGENLNATGLVSMGAAMTGTNTTNTANVSANSTGSGINVANIDVNANADGASGAAEIDIASNSDEGTAKIRLTAEAHDTAQIFINADGAVDITTPLTNIISSTINCGTGTMKRVLTDIAAQVYNNHTHGGVMSGGSDTGIPNQPITSGDEAQNLYAS